METFSRKKPTDEMFSEDRGLKDLVRDWLQNSADDVIIDQNLIGPEDPKKDLKLQCFAAIMQLALRCAAASPEERVNIGDALQELQRIKLSFTSQ